MNAAVASNMRRSPGGRVHRIRDFVHMAEDFSAGACEVVEHVFGGLSAVLEHLKFPGFSRYALSRAINGRHNPLARIAVWMVVLRITGASREQAQLLLDWQGDVLDRLWPPSQLDPVQLSIREQVAEAAENPLQARYLAGDHSVAPAYQAALREERAALSALILALDPECRAAEGAIAA